MRTLTGKKFIFAATFLVALHGTGGNADDGTSALPLPDNVEHTVLLDYPKAPDPDFTFADAARLCAQKKPLEGVDYFYVICKIIPADRKENVFEFVEKPNFKFMGYSVTNTYDYWGYLFSTQSPIYEKYFIRKEELTKVLTKRIYRLIIWGIGPDPANLPKKLLYSSADAGDGNYPVYFDKPSEARSACGDVLDERKVKNPNALVYERAKCDPLQNPQNDKFYFNIVTQNPLIRGRGIAP